MEMSPQDIADARLACILAESDLRRLWKKNNLSSVGEQQLRNIVRLRKKIDKYIDAERIEVATYIA